MAILLPDRILRVFRPDVVTAADSISDPSAFPYFAFGHRLLLHDLPVLVEVYILTGAAGHDNERQAAQDQGGIHR